MSPKRSFGYDTVLRGGDDEGVTSTIARTSETADEFYGHAASIMWRHWWRGFSRVSVLAATDALTFLAVVGLMTGFGGPRVVSLAHSVFDPGESFIIALVLSLAVAGTYRPGDRWHDPVRLLAGVIFAITLNKWAYFTQAPSVNAVVTSVLAGLPLWLGLTSARQAVHVVVRRVRRSRERGPRSVLVGATSDCVDMQDHGALGDRGEFDVLGYIDASHAWEGEQRPSYADFRLGTLHDIERILHDLDVDTVIVCGDAREDIITRVVRAAMLAECHVLAVSRAMEISGVQPGMVWRGGPAVC